MNISYSSEDTNFIRCFKNVSSYSYLEGDKYAWEISCEDEQFPTDSQIPLYFILDSANNAAFSHWVYESSTWLPKFQEILLKYPSCFLVIDTFKSYKKLFTSFYGIPQESICFKSEIQPTNYCFFHLYTSLNDPNIPSIYFSNLALYKDKLHTYSEIKDIPLLYLPRGEKENFIGPNNRCYNIQEKLKQFVSEIGGTVYETDSTRSLVDQIQIVKRSHILLLDYGSNLWVNGLFAENSFLLCLNIGWHQHEQLPSLETIWNNIQRNNSIHQVFAQPCPDIPVNSDGVPITQFDMTTVVKTLLSLKETLYEKSTKKKEEISQPQP